MPNKPKRPCQFPGCPELTETRSCAKHKRQVMGPRLSPAQRGYDARWRRLRKTILAKYPLCQHCLERGAYVPTSEVDHIDGNVQNNSPSNLQALCKPCHSRKTMTKLRGRGGRMSDNFA